MAAFFFCSLISFWIPKIYLQMMLQESVAQKKMPTNKQLVIPGVTEASGLDLIFQDLLIYVADTEQGVNLLKLAGSRSRQGLTPAGQILKLTVGINNLPASGCVWFFVNGFGSFCLFVDLERPKEIHLLVIKISNLISGKIRLLDRTCQNNKLYFQFCQGDSVTALAVDWVTSSLYWSSIKKPLLHVTTRSGDHTAVLLQPSVTVTEALLQF